MHRMSKEVSVHPKVIRNEVDYEQALNRVDELIDAGPGSPEGDELELWTILIEAYERTSHPIAPPDPVEAIRFRMDQLGLRPVDLAPYLGGRSRVSEILNRKRTLSIAMIVALSENWGFRWNLWCQSRGPADPIAPNTMSSGRARPSARTHGCVESCPTEALPSPYPRMITMLGVEG